MFIGCLFILYFFITRERERESIYLGFINKEEGLDNLGNRSKFKIIRINKEREGFGEISYEEDRIII